MSIVKMPEYLRMDNGQLKTCIIETIALYLMLSTNILH